MGEYVKDEVATMERVGELMGSVRWAQYELGAALAVLRALGVPWETIGEAMGYAEGGRKQAASQWFKRNGLDAAALDDAEWRRLGRVLALGSRADRFKVRLIVGGKRGISQVLYREVSTHLSREKAEARARKLEGKAEVWRVDATGKMERLALRRVKAAPARPAPHDPTSF